MSIVRTVIGGVDTHADFHVAAAIDGNGAMLGIESFPADAAGYEELLGWLASFGAVTLVGVEGTGSWGVGLARFLHDHEVETVEVDRPNRQKRRKRGKSDPIDAEAAARAALSGEASVTRRPATARSNRCECCWWRAVRHVPNGSRPSTSSATWSSVAQSRSGSGSRIGIRPVWLQRQQTCGPVRVPTLLCSRRI